MAPSINLYNHTARRFADGSNSGTDTYKLMLATAAVFDADDEALGDVDVTEVAEANGYLSGGATLAGLTVETVGVNGAKFDADNAVWSASGGPIAASFAILYNDSDTDDAPVAFIDFDGEQSAGDGTDFIIVWNDDGIFTWTVV